MKGMKGKKKQIGASSSSAVGKRKNPAAAASSSSSAAVETEASSSRSKKKHPGVFQFFDNVAVDANYDDEERVCQLQRSTTGRALL